MNKKISTLLAGVMLASAFSVNAAMENGKSYLLKSGSNYLSAETDKTSADYGKLVYGSLSTVLGKFQQRLLLELLSTPS